MPTPGERKALLFLSVLLVAGTGVRVARAVGGESVAEGDRAALARQLAAVDSARSAKASGRGGARRGAATGPARRPRAASKGSSAPALDPGARSARAAAAALAARAAREAEWEQSRARLGPLRAQSGSRVAKATGASPGGSDAAPIARGELIDLDTAPASRLERLPRIGPALAQRIVEDRRRNGPFGSLQALQRVRGVGPKMTELLRDRVTFSGRRSE